MRGLTIDELAARVGMTVRTVRAHQSRGLLPPPDVRGRTGYYGPAHVARLELVKDMQADGFNLRAIRHTLDQLPPGAEAEALAFRRALLQRWSDEPPEVVDRADLTALTGPIEPDLVAECVRLGALVPVGRDRFEVPSPPLLRVAAELVALGVPLRALVGVQRALSEHAAGVARAYVDLFVDHVWSPFVAAGRPEDRWPAVVHTLERMQPLASQALLATFRLEMERAIAGAVGKDVGRDGRSGSAG